MVDAIQQGTARVVECDGKITGYTSNLAFFGHSVEASDDDVKALILAASESFRDRSFPYRSRTTSCSAGASRQAWSVPKRDSRIASIDTEPTSICPNLSADSPSSKALAGSKAG